MASFDLQAFVEAPSRRLLESCRKADLLEVATHYSLLVPKQLTKDALRALVLDFLETNEILPPSLEAESHSPSPKEEEKERPEKTCPSETSSPHPSPPSSPLTGARLKLKLARMRIEAVTELIVIQRALNHRKTHTDY